MYISEEGTNTAIDENIQYTLFCMNIEKQNEQKIKQKNRT